MFVFPSSFFSRDRSKAPACRNQSNELLHHQPSPRLQQEEEDYNTFIPHYSLVFLPVRCGRMLALTSFISREWWTAPLFFFTTVINT